MAENTHDITTTSSNLLLGAFQYIRTQASEDTISSLFILKGGGHHC